MRRALGLPEIYHPYSLRHFVATRLILDGLDEIQVAKFLGTSVEMLQKVYANHIDRDAQRRIGLAVTRLFGESPTDTAREAPMPYMVKPGSDGHGLGAIARAYSMDSVERHGHRDAAYVGCSEGLQPAGLVAVAMRT